MSVDDVRLEPTQVSAHYTDGAGGRRDRCPGSVATHVVEGLRDIEDLDRSPDLCETSDHRAFFEEDDVDVVPWDEFCGQPLKHDLRTGRACDVGD